MANVLKFCAAILFIGILPLPYIFYMFLRLIITIAAFYFAFKVVPRDSNDFFILIVIGILFNPIMPVFLFKALWIPIDIGTGIYFLNLSKKNYF